MKNYSYQKCKVVYLKKSRKYTSSSTGNALTEDLLFANQWYMDMDNETILQHLRDDLRSEAKILEVIVTAIIL